MVSAAAAELACITLIFFFCATWKMSVQAAASASETPSPNYLSPIAAKFSPDGATLYVVCEDDDSVLAVDVRAERVVKKVKVGHKPKDLAVSLDGKTIYVSNEWSDSVSVVDAATLQVRNTLQTGWGPRGLTTDRPGRILYVANSIGNDVSVIDVATGTERKRLTALRSPHYVQLSRTAGTCTSPTCWRIWNQRTKRRYRN